MDAGERTDAIVLVHSHPKHWQCIDRSALTLPEHLRRRFWWPSNGEIEPADGTVVRRSSTGAGRKDEQGVEKENLVVTVDVLVNWLMDWVS